MAKSMSTTDPTSRCQAPYQLPWIFQHLNETCRSGIFGRSPEVEWTSFGFSEIHPSIILLYSISAFHTWEWVASAPLYHYGITIPPRQCCCFSNMTIVIWKPAAPVGCPSVIYKISLPVCSCRHSGKNVLTLAQTYQQYRLRIVSADS